MSAKFVPKVQSTIASNGLDNGLVSIRRQAIIWNNADPIHWRIYGQKAYELVNLRGPHKISCPYIIRYVVYWLVKIHMLLDLQAR